MAEGSKPGESKSRGDKPRANHSVRLAALIGAAFGVLVEARRWLTISAQQASFDYIAGLIGRTLGTALVLSALFALVGTLLNRNSS